MLRFIVAVVVIAIVVSYFIIPLFPALRNLFKSEAQRIDQAFNNKKEDDE